jgi:hypothetical protein
VKNLGPDDNADGVETRSLSGEWRFALDPDDRGVNRAWWRQDLAGTIRLPGSLQEQGFGHEVTAETAWTGSIFDCSWRLEERYAKYRQPGNVKIPFWLQPERHYIGAAWFQKEIEIPAGWHERRVILFMERCHWETSVWLDETPLGACDSLATPHVYELGDQATPGRHRLTIRVDNRVRIDVGPNAHSVSDHIQTNWNGIIGRLELQATPRIWIEDMQVFPQAREGRLRVVVSIGNRTGRAQAGSLELRLQGLSVTRPWAVAEEGGLVETDCPIADDGTRWDEFTPVLQTLAVSLDGGGAITRTFGWREFAAQGTQFTINGRPTFLRGTHDAGCFPLTGYPAMDVEAWRRIFQVIREHGLNHVRYHSWCPPEAAFQAADELGVYLQVECGVWANQGATIGDGGPLDRWLYAETDRILKAYGNHPSFVMLAHGNEPAGARHVEYLREWVMHYRGRGDGRRLYTCAANYPNFPENEYQNPSGVQQHSWGQGVQSRLNSLPPATDFDYGEWVARYPVPVVGHEIGQWCAYPNLDEIDKYTGLLRARNFELFRETLTAKGMGDQARDFLSASGKLQVLCYRHEIEAQLRTRGLGGFVLLDLHDFPGQGTALVGMLDAFWESKGYMQADAFRRFCAPTVVLASMPKRVWTDAEAFAADLEVAHYGAAVLPEATAEWRITDAQGSRCASGVLPHAVIPPGGVAPVGAVRWPLAEVAAPARYRLTVTLGGSGVENDWEFWVFPAATAVEVPPGVMVSSRLGDTEWLHLGQGGRLLLLPAPAEVPTPVQIGFSPIYWNTAWTINQAPHTLGLLCDPAHPALAQFPTESHSNWQWWDLIRHGAAMVLDGLPRNLRPIVQPIDDWHHNRRLGLVFEAKVNGGRVLVCSADLRTDLAQRPAARQFLRSLLAYMASEKFAPEVELTPHAVKQTIGRSG